MNISLLCKWWWKLEKSDGLWQKLIKEKYFHQGVVGTVKHRLDDSPVWNDLLKVKHIYLKGRKIKVKNGKGTSFWVDAWLEKKPLCVLHPVLYDLCTDKNISTYQFLLRHGQLGFPRWLTPLLFAEWLGIINDVYQYPFENSRDIPRWDWNKNNTFSSKSVYEALTKENSRKRFKHIWKAKLPYKIKIFMWLVENDAILTKDNLLHRHWVGDPTCSFCHDTESIEHLFFHCPIAKIIWGIIGLCFGANDIPRSIQQYNNWVAKWLPGGETVYTSGFTQADVRRFVGQSGNAETKPALTKNILKAQWKL